MALLALRQCKESISLEVQVRSYRKGGKMAVLLVDWSVNEPESCGKLTINLGVPAVERQDI